MAQITTSDLPDLLSAAELAQYLGVPVSTIHFWRGKGEGSPGFKVGKSLRFRAVDVEHWLEERSREVSSR